MAERTTSACGPTSSQGSLRAVTEPVMATIKRECLHRGRFTTRDEVRLAVLTSIEGFSNLHRRRSSLGNLSPAELERRLEQRRQETVAC